MHEFPNPLRVHVTSWDKRKYFFIKVVLRNKLPRISNPTLSLKRRAKYSTIWTNRIDNIKHIKSLISVNLLKICIYNSIQDTGVWQMMTYLFLTSLFRELLTNNVMTLTSLFIIPVWDSNGINLHWVFEIRICYLGVVWNQFK